MNAIILQQEEDYHSIDARRSIPVEQIAFIANNDSSTGEGQLVVQLWTKELIHTWRDIIFEK